MFVFSIPPVRLTGALSNQLHHLRLGNTRSPLAVLVFTRSATEVDRVLIDSGTATLSVEMIENTESFLTYTYKGKNGDHWLVVESVQCH